MKQKKIPTIKVRLLYLRKSGPYLVERTIQHRILEDLVKVNIRGTIAYTTKTVLAAVRKQRRGAVKQAEPRRPGKPRAPRQEAEEILVRVDYKGGGRKKKGGQPAGRYGRAIVNVRVLVRGTQAERDRIHATVADTLLKQMRFLSPDDIQRSKLKIGRTPGKSSQRLEVKDANVSDGRGRRHDFKRPLSMDLQAELDPET